MSDAFLRFHEQLAAKGITPTALTLDETTGVLEDVSWAVDGTAFRLFGEKSPISRSVYAVGPRQTYARMAYHPAFRLARPFNVWTRGVTTPTPGGGFGANRVWWSHDGRTYVSSALQDYEAEHIIDFTVHAFTALLQRVQQVEGAPPEWAAALLTRLKDLT